MEFECIKISGKRKDVWAGKVTSIERFGSHIEVFIVSRSSILLIIGPTKRGYFACMPDFNVGCHLVDFRDDFWNKERLMGVLGKVDGITVAYALQMLLKSNVFDNFLG